MLPIAQNNTQPPGISSNNVSKALYIFSFRYSSIFSEAAYHLTDDMRVFGINR